MRIIHVSVCLALAFASFVQAQSGITSAFAQGSGVTSPAAHFGFELAADGKYAMWDQEVAYYEKLAKESDRIDLQVLGKSTLGRPFILLTISSPQNLAKLDRYKEISRQMADPRGLTPQQIDALSAEGRAVVLVTLGQHSTEVASGQMGPRLVHRLATRNDDQIRTILDNTIFLLIPSFNPDGHDIVGDWVKKSAGTPYEGAGPPELYGAYIGHDNNRDGYMLSQVESQHWAKVVYQDWFPQVLQRHASDGKLWLAPRHPAEVRSHQSARRSADVAHVAVAWRRDGDRARSRRGDRRRIAGSLRCVVHGVVPWRSESVEHHELSYRERQRPIDLAAVYPSAADSARLARPSREQSADDVPTSVAGRLVAHVRHRAPAGNRNTRAGRNDGALSSEFSEESSARGVAPGRERRCRVRPCDSDEPARPGHGLEVRVDDDDERRRGASRSRTIYVRFARRRARRSDHQAGSAVASVHQDDDRAGGVSG